MSLNLKKNKNIWFFHHYATPPNMTGLTRPYDFGVNLKKKGYKVAIFSSSYLHYSDENLIGDNKKYIIYNEEEIPFVFVKTRSYSSSGVRRILNMIDFYIGLVKNYKKYVKINGKPDVIIASSPHPLTMIAGIQIAKKLKIKCICEVRDLWPESIVEYSSKLTRNNPLIKLLYKGEKWIYKRADKLIFTMPGGIDYIKEKKWCNDIDLRKIHNINNGVDLSKFNYNKENFRVKDKDLENENIIKIVYTGSIRKVNNLGKVLDVAKNIKNSNVKFLIWGRGNELDYLKNRCKREGIKSVYFKGPVDKKNIPYIISNADINLLHFKNTELLRFGISTNKLFEYYAAKKPILSTVQFEYDEINLITGVTSKSQNIDDIIKSIENLINIDDDFKDIIKINSERLSRKYDFKNLTNELIDIIENV